MIKSVIRVSFRLTQMSLQKLQEQQSQHRQPCLCSQGWWFGLHKEKILYRYYIHNEIKKHNFFLHLTCKKIVKKYFVLNKQF